MQAHLPSIFIYIRPSSILSILSDLKRVPSEKESATDTDMQEKMSTNIVESVGIDGSLSSSRIKNENDGGFSPFL